MMGEQLKFLRPRAQQRDSIVGSKSRVALENRGDANLITFGLISKKDRHQVAAALRVKHRSPLSSVACGFVLLHARLTQLEPATAAVSILDGALPRGATPVAARTCR
jgi:hypothetical protein